MSFLSTKAGSSYSLEQQRQLLRLAREAISDKLHGRDRVLRLQDFDPKLQQQGASFVTLHHKGSLCGCIGSLSPHQSLLADIRQNAQAAAFSDSRFPALTEAELNDLDIHISVLNPPVPMSFDSESDLVRQLRPGIDGLILEDGNHRGTFLPSVWQSLPHAVDFLRQLKRKAGLDSDYWSPTITVQRYTVIAFPDESATNGADRP